MLGPIGVRSGALMDQTSTGAAPGPGTVLTVSSEMPHAGDQLKRGPETLATFVNETSMVPRHPSYRGVVILPHPSVERQLTTAISADARVISILITTPVVLTVPNQAVPGTVTQDLTERRSIWRLFIVPTRPCAGR